MIFQAGQEKGNKSLLDWTRDVVNHYWYSAEISKTTDEFLVGFLYLMYLILRFDISLLILLDAQFVESICWNTMLYA